MEQIVNSRKKMVMAWALAIIITLAAGWYQRVTGPSHPLKVNAGINGKSYVFSLARSGSSSDNEIQVPVTDKDVKGYVIYRRYPTNENWDTLAMQPVKEGLSAFLPVQPPAGKLEYFLMFRTTGQPDMLLQQQPTIIRFKGDVPLWILLPHILFIFFGMLFSNLAGLLAAFNFSRARIYSLITFILIMLGGMILGPVVQKYAFGEFWTGVPWGWDLTDNKTLLAFLAWLAALFFNRNKLRPGYIIAAALVTLIIFSIPHSMFGSELNPATGTITQG